MTRKTNSNTQKQGFDVRAIVGCLYKEGHPYVLVAEAENVEIHKNKRGEVEISLETGGVFLDRYNRSSDILKIVLENSVGTLEKREYRGSLFKEGVKCFSCPYFIFALKEGNKIITHSPKRDGSVVQEIYEFDPKSHRINFIESDKYRGIYIRIKKSSQVNYENNSKS
ncbi:MAG: hypothetical protein QXQ14_02820 [Candidatus Aenigmatarchaeota archaeon]